MSNYIVGKFTNSQLFYPHKSANYVNIELLYAACVMFKPKPIYYHSVLCALCNVQSHVVAKFIAQLSLIYILYTLPVPVRFYFIRLFFEKHNNRIFPIHHFAPENLLIHSDDLGYAVVVLFILWRFAADLLKYGEWIL